MSNLGFFSALRSRFERNRLGELLVQRGKLSPDQLRIALKTQKDTGQNLGSVLQQLDYATKIQVRRTLIEQTSYRAMAAMFTLFISVTSFAGGGVKASPYTTKPNATSSPMIYKAAYHPNGTQPLVTAPKKFDQSPNLFGSKEVGSPDITAFKKWTEVLEKLEQVSFKPSQLEQFYALPMSSKIEAVNEYVNQVNYIEDKNNFGKTDYWATPTEFFTRGGDCEDFAIAKYALLKKLGISEDKMRLAIVQDKIKNIPHAVLIVYSDNGTVVLDNQVKSAKQMASVTRYKPIYSINATGWWRHLT